MSGDHNIYQSGGGTPAPFRYIPSAQTNVAATWRRFGWTPPAETNPERYRQIRAELNAIA